MRKVHISDNVYIESFFGGFGFPQGEVDIVGSLVQPLEINSSDVITTKIESGSPTAVPIVGAEAILIEFEGEDTGGDDFIDWVFLATNTVADEDTFGVTATLYGTTSNPRERGKIQVSDRHGEYVAGATLTVVPPNGSADTLVQTLFHTNFRTDAIPGLQNTIEEAIEAKKIEIADEIWQQLREGH